MGDDPEANSRDGLCLSASRRRVTSKAISAPCCGRRGSVAHLGLTAQDVVDAVGQHHQVGDGPLGAAFLPPGVLDGHDIDARAERRCHRKAEGRRPARVRSEGGGMPFQ